MVVGRPEAKIWSSFSRSTSGRASLTPSLAHLSIPRPWTFSAVGVSASMASSMTAPQGNELVDVTSAYKPRYIDVRTTILSRSRISEIHTGSRSMT